MQESEKSLLAENEALKNQNEEVQARLEATLKDLEGTNEKMAVWEERHGDLKQLLDKADTAREGLNTEIKKLVSENAQKEAEIKESKRSLAEARTLLERTRRQQKDEKVNGDSSEARWAEVVKKAEQKFAQTDDLRMKATVECEKLHATLT